MYAVLKNAWQDRLVDQILWEQEGVEHPDALFSGEWKLNWMGTRKLGRNKETYIHRACVYVGTERTDHVFD